MIFSFFEFVIFFLIFIFILKKNKNYQQIIIILSSILFYCFWEILNILLIIYIVFTLYICLKKKWELKYSILLILLPLLYFKYSYFFLDIFNIHIF